MPHSNRSLSAVRRRHLLSWKVTGPAIRQLFPTIMVGEENLSRISGPKIWVGNHTHLIDPWTITHAGLSYEAFKRESPLSPVASQSFKNPFLRFLTLRLIYPFYGTRPMGERGKEDCGNGTVKLGPWIEDLKMGISCLIFAEGHIRREADPEIRPFRRGAIDLQRAVEVPIVPFAFRYEEPGKLRPQRCVLAIGAPYFSGNGEVMREAEMLRKVVEALYERCGEYFS